MNKQNNILRMIKNIIYLIAGCAFLCACTDDEIYSSTNVKEGIPVTMHFDLSVAGMDVLTRALPDAEESRINDLYVFVFNKNGRLKNSKFFTTDEVVSSMDNKKNGQFSIETTSGECYIYAVANVETNELEPLVNKLNAVTSIDELTKVFAKLDEPNVQRIQGSLVMSGAFEPISSAKGKKTGYNTGYCVIDGDGNHSDGIIKLSRLDSHITFKIKVGNEVTSFTPTSWQVINVPMKSNVIEQPGVNNFTDELDYENSKINTAFGTDNTDNARVFDFYMLENIKKAKTYQEADGTVSSIDPKGGKAEYAKREAEVKEKDGKNTGEYKYSEKYATYVEIKAALEIVQDDGTKRVANVQYRIHLGGGIDNPHIFTSERNAKYTYNITINNVNDIIVEVTREEENRPGAEGDVIDSQAEVRTLDAHYNSFVMGFSYNHVANPVGIPNLKFLVKTPFGEVTESSTPDDKNAVSKQDYHWIQFRSHGSENLDSRLQTYQKEELVDLFGLAQDVINRYYEDGANNPDKLYYYTVFIDEYYYTEAPSGQNWGNDPKTYWHYFANADNRYVILVYAPEYSLDGNSSYAQARYMITQRSIQTYYSKNSEVALGMEHVNETGMAIWGTPDIGKQISSANGLWNTWKYLEKNRSWATYVDLETPDKDMNTFTTKGNTLALARCLSRNRDENGDGIISPDEVKWYVPTSEQLMGMYLGAKSLPTPLYDANNINFVYSEKEKYHYTTSDKKRIWSEEGASVGDYSGSVNDKSPENFRCVRNLGMDKKSEDAIKKTEYPQQAFEYIPEGTLVKVYNQQTQQDEIVSADRVFKMSRLTELNIRGSRLSRGEIGLHDNFEEGNKPYKAFQMAQNSYTEKMPDDVLYNAPVYEGDSFFNILSWHGIIRSCSISNNFDEIKFKPNTDQQHFRLITKNDVSICKNYSEKEDESDKGLWRAPNQRELMLMYIQNKGFVNGTMCRTKWRYVLPSGQFNAGNLRFFCASATLYLSNDTENKWNGKVRCVRDVEIVNN